MVWAVMLTLALLLSPSVALAEPEQETNGTESVMTNTPDNDLPVVQVNTDNTETNKKIDQLTHVMGEVSTKLDKLEDIDKGLDDVESSVTGVSGKVDGIIAGQATPEPAPVEKLAAGSRLVINAYANVSPTGTYATYAKQLIPKMDWNDDYVYVQDSSSSYVIVWGDLEYHSAGTVTGSQCEYVRWYYSGTGSGYVVQSGSGDVELNLGNYVVLSSLGDYPLLDDGFTLYRQEVAFYALCAVVIYSLHHCWGFLLRMRGISD